MQELSEHPHNAMVLARQASNEMIKLQSDQAVWSRRIDEVVDYIAPQR